MREYKFRAWIKKEKKMVEVLEINFKERKISIPVENEYYNIVKNFDDVILMQYLERNDVNKKNLCEGDIIRLTNQYTGEVFNDPEDLVQLFYANFEVQFYCKSLSGDEYHFYSDGLYSEDGCYSFEIIGNIHENPELLGVTND